LPQREGQLGDIAPVTVISDGETKGNNPELRGNNWDTDLPGGYESAVEVFYGLVNLDAGAGGDNSFSFGPFLARPTTLVMSKSGNIGLRASIRGGKTVWRVDIKANAFSLKRSETIHFNGQGGGAMCGPT
jgi:hypothetical protein